MSIIVNCLEKTITFDGVTYPCRIGKNGFVSGVKGREGDGKTPCGDYQIRFGLYRDDRLPSPPPGDMKFMALQPDDGWCDDPEDRAYNRFIRLPYPASHERLHREDGAYDIVLVFSHNDGPPQKNLGSAVFLHVAQPDDRATLGCVAVSPDIMVKLVRFAQNGTILTII